MQILIFIEDNPGDALIIREFLVEEAPNFFQIERYEQLEPGLQRLDEGGVDVILLDLFLPDSQGLDTFQRVYERHPDIPIVIVSSLRDQDAALEAMKAGAEDFLVKGEFSARDLVKALFYAIARNEAKKATKTLKQVTQAIGKLSEDAKSLKSDSYDINKAAEGLDAKSDNQR
jgi:DNA-binding NarL/FixJ family response regulator